MNEWQNEYSFAPPMTLTRSPEADRRSLCMPAIGMAFIFVFTVVLQVLLLVPVQLLAPELVEKGWFLMLASNGTMYAIAMPMSLFFFRMAPVAPDRSPKKRLSFPVFLGLVGICFLLTYAGNFVSGIVNSILEAITGIPQTNPIADVTLNTPLWANLLFVGILAPIMEEIFFRKLVIDRIRTFGELPAILISGIAFGLIHGNFSQFFYAAAIGILFGYVYLRTGKLRYTIGLHMVVNLVGGVFTTEATKLLGDVAALEETLLGSETVDLSVLTNSQLMGVMMMISYAVFIVAAIIGGIVALCLLWRRIRFVKAEPALTPGEWVRVVLVNPGTWIFLIVSGAMFFMN